jgi:hypothetical protein
MSPNNTKYYKIQPHVLCIIRINGIMYCVIMYYVVFIVDPWIPDGYSSLHTEADQSRSVPHTAQLARALLQAAAAAHCAHARTPHTNTNTR